MLNVPEVSLKTFCPDDPPFYHNSYSCSIRPFQTKRQKVKYVCKHASIYYVWIFSEKFSLSLWERSKQPWPAHVQRGPDEARRQYGLYQWWVMVTLSKSCWTEGTQGIEGTLRLIVGRWRGPGSPLPLVCRHQLQLGGRGGAEGGAAVRGGAPQPAVGHHSGALLLQQQCGYNTTFLFNMPCIAWL